MILAHQQPGDVGTDEPDEADRANEGDGRGGTTAAQARRRPERSFLASAPTFTV